MSYIALDYECESCGFMEGRLVYRSERKTIKLECVKCKSPMREVLSLPTAKEATASVLIREHEDDSTRPSTRRGVTGPVIKVKESPRGAPPPGTDLGNGYYVPSAPVRPPWERKK